VYFFLGRGGPRCRAAQAIGRRGGAQCRHGARVQEAARVERGDWPFYVLSLSLSFSDTACAYLQEELTAVRNESDAAKLVHKLQAEKDDAVSQLNKLKVKAKTRIQELQAALEAAKGTAAAAAAADTPLQTPTASSFSPSNNSSTVVKQLEDELEQTQQALMEQKKELASTSVSLLSLVALAYRACRPCWRSAPSNWSRRRPR